MKIGKKLNAKLEHHMARSRALLYEVSTHIYIYIYICVCYSGYAKRHEEKRNVWCKFWQLMRD